MESVRDKSCKELEKVRERGSKKKGKLKAAR